MNKTKIKLIKYKKIVPIDINKSIEIVQIEQTLEFNCGIIKEDSLPELPKISREVITHRFYGFNNMDRSNFEKVKQFKNKKIICLMKSVQK